MDKAAQVAANMNLDPVKEPRGFIRIIEFILAIFAFATTTSHSSSSSFTVACPKGSVDITVDFSYPYRLGSQNNIQTPICNETKTGEANLYGNFASSAEFYVFVGVMAFLYTLGALVLYIFFDEKYRKHDIIPIADFVATLVFTALWLISSSAWAQGLTDLKYYSNPTNIFTAREIDECSDPNKNMCTVKSTGNFASLNASIMFGFLNMLVWGANLWFLYKETKWFKVQEKPVIPPNTQEVPGHITPTLPVEEPRV